MAKNKPVKKHLKNHACKMLKQIKDHSNVVFTSDPTEVTCMYCKAECWDKAVRGNIMDDYSLNVMKTIIEHGG